MVVVCVAVKGEPKDMVVPKVILRYLEECLHRRYLDRIHALMVVRQSGLDHLVGSSVFHYIG